MKLQDLKNKKIVVLGMGINHEKLASHLRKHQIQFDTIEQWKNPDELVTKLEKYQVVFRTPGLPFLSEAVQRVIRRGGRVTSQTQLFFGLCPAPIIGVTGTKGKGTTATLLSKILEMGSGRKIWLAGNIGLDPFDFLEKLRPEDLVVLELSSFQLQDMSRSPHVAVVLKITPEHLDHHRDFREYVLAKENIVKHQKNTDFAVVNYDSEVTREFAKFSLGKIFWNSTEEPVKPGCFIRSEKIILADEKREIEVMQTGEVRLLGRFNLENVTAAIAAAAAVGVSDPVVIREVVSGFEGLPHRLEFVRSVGNVKFYNDSFATTPETTMAALSAFSEPTVLIVGGSEKNADYTQLGSTIAGSKVAALLPIGKTGPRIAESARRAGYRGKILDRAFGNMEEIVVVANEVARPGDVVLLSPASASLDMFSNYKHRGELFKKFVSRLK
ncbi:MAG: UDP-N-acetylmuramoylalanine--D-glutamate ligase [Candidatus Doudnabacteria bacterium RIFCSPHIGHO2_01_52_17]|uniref:UDP-N-acetylmuramoylalanine--D-glutamate ligase n=1 Tax=Candidatus Doudnabacteria bacterium RIFCSPHIGHO2_01_52_17 TaxID=1817820 RepID=A0A1F5NAC4_9BACT|nr:MAG: UDP-N-acetylmuramoylalanine--D-glutamate ligase [Candidatus Doudnabacteria bacterium RIFCSPHIGHO2_01_52_17]